MLTSPRIETASRKQHGRTLLNYPLKNIEICLNNRKFQLTVVDDPDQYLETLSKEDVEGTLFLPYWTYLWESSIGLAQYLSDNRTTLSNKSILEIGCGYGLAGIVTAKLGAEVTFTDFEHDALLFTRHNSQQNETSTGTYVQMDWSAPCFQKRFNVVLGADVIYEEQNWDSIIELLQNLLELNGIAIFSEPNRKNADEFFKLIRENGFTFKKSICSISLQEKTAKINIFQVKHTKR
ncbi:methyltransferase domain-containing protein [Candidatus Poribacteria bacterium]|nr:methyltransferase domain-containing protein [Candidatus Poribacteria bacterium]MYF56835.1 methyltransferase domain-containing protein [Candidatus Poribacteria bacterium]